MLAVRLGFHFAGDVAIEARCLASSPLGWLLSREGLVRRLVEVLSMWCCCSAVFVLLLLAGVNVSVSVRGFCRFP